MVLFSPGRSRTGVCLAMLALLASCQEASVVATSQKAISCDEEGPPAQLTFRKDIRSKLFIDRIPLGMCNPSGVLSLILDGPGRYAQYMAFCKLTDESYKERPETGTDNPLEARVQANVHVSWTCQQGQSRPVSGSLSAENTIGGAELGPIFGAPDPTALRDNIAQSGEFAYVTSGRPNLLLEPAFAYFRPRLRPHIWHRVKGTITCSTDSSGQLTSQLDVKFDAVTKFPSHRLYLYNVDQNGGNPTFERMVSWIPQDKFSNLWHLPAVGTP